MDPFIHYGMAAAMQASRDAGLPTDERSDEDAERIGVHCRLRHRRPAADRGRPRRAREARPAPDLAVLRAGSIINMISGQLSIMFGLKGPNLAIVTACTTGPHCIGEAGRLDRATATPT